MKNRCGIGQFAIWYQVAKKIDKFHPPRCFDQDERAPQVALSPAVAILPLQDSHDVDVDKTRKNQQKRRNTAKGLSKILSEPQSKQKWHTNERHPAKESNPPKPVLPTVDHADIITRFRMC